MQQESYICRFRVLQICRFTVSPLCCYSVCTTLTFANPLLSYSVPQPAIPANHLFTKNLRTQFKIGRLIIEITTSTVVLIIGMMMRVLVENKKIVSCGEDLPGQLIQIMISTSILLCISNGCINEKMNAPIL